MQKYDSSLPPPVPPRRKRCKSETRRQSPTKFHATNFERKHRSAPIPPTAPQRSKVGRKTPSPLPNKSNFLPTNLHDSLEYSLSDHNESKCIISADINHEGSYYQNYYDNNIEELQKKSKKLENEYLEINNSKGSRSSSPFFKSPEPNKYPSLYFTFDDYKIVMQEESHDLESYSNDLLQQIEETSNKIEELSEKVDEVTFQVEEIKDQIDEISEQAMSPFAENILFENEREEIYFRVTTTDRPFQKCLGEWSTLCKDNHNHHQAEESSNYVFEDYLDRNNKLNRPDILKINEELCFVSQEENSESTEKSTTRVRFIIESPSTSTPDIDLDDDGTSYVEFIEKKLLNHDKSSMQLSEITDKEIDEFDMKISEIIDDESATITENQLDSETVNEKNVSDSLCALTVNQVNNSYSEWDEDIDGLSSLTFIEDNPQWEPQIEENISSEDSDNVYLDSKIEDKNIYEAVKEISEKKTMFVDSSFYNLSEEDEWESFFEKDQVCLQREKIDEKSKMKFEQLAIQELVGIDERDDTIDETPDKITADVNVQTASNSKIKKKSSTTPKDEKKPTVNIDLQNIPIIEISSAKDKAVPENVLRNFFLETMLINNNLPENSKDATIENCKIVATHLKQDLNTSPDQLQCINIPATVISVITSETEVVLKDKMKIKLTECGMQPEASNNKKITGESRGDVLNELLTNFSSIKLKPVKTVVRQLFPMSESGESQIIKEEYNKIKTEKNNEIRPMVDIFKNNSKSVNSDFLTEITTNNNSDDILHVKKDTSAIIIETLHAEHSDNDNKITTPIVVSKDQPHEAASIIPGSVKNFVKYYEIQSEICSLAKIKDNLFKKQIDRTRDKNKSKSTKVNEKSKKIEKKNASPKKAEVNVTGEIIKNFVQDPPLSSSSPKSSIPKQSCLKAEPSPKSERRKSVQFDSEDTIIYSSKREKEKASQKSDGDGALSSLIGGIKTKIKKSKSPTKANSNISEPQNGLKFDELGNDGAAIICIQKSPQKENVTCPAIPGNRSFLPQTKTPQNNQTIVFYCTL